MYKYLDIIIVFFLFFNILEGNRQWLMLLVFNSFCCQVIAYLNGSPVKYKPNFQNAL